MNEDIISETIGMIIGMILLLFPVWILIANTIYKIEKNKREVEKFKYLTEQQKEEELKHKRELEKFKCLTAQQKEAELNHKRELEKKECDYKIELLKKELQFESDVEKEIERLNQEQYIQNVQNEARRRMKK